MLLKSFSEESEVHLLCVESNFSCTWPIVAVVDRGFGHMGSTISLFARSPTGMDSETSHENTEASVSFVDISPAGSILVRESPGEGLFSGMAPKLCVCDKLET